MKAKTITYVICCLIWTGCNQDFDAVDIMTENVDFDDYYRGDASTFEERMHAINRTILLTPYISEIPTQGRVLNQTSTQLDYYWQHIASVDAPVIDGVQLSATHFDFKNDLAYVSYHKQGDIHLGAVNIIDLNDPHYPAITDELIFGSADINALTADADGTIYLATSHEKKGAVVYRLPTVNTTFETTLQRYSLSNSIEGGVSASANGVALTTESVVVSSGKSYGGTFVLDKNTMRPQNVIAYSNSKYVVTTEVGNQEYHISLMTGTASNLLVKQADLSSGTYEEFSLPNIIHRNVVATYRGKSTMEVSALNPREVYVALGKEGLKSYDILSGEEQSSSKGTMLVTGNTNGVTMDEDFLYIANGADGLSIASHPESGIIDPLFYWDLPEQPASVNFTKANEEFIFVAKGEGGFHILKKTPKAPYATVTTYNQQGVPENMVQKEICADLLPTIFSEALPERQNTMNAHPEYFEMPTKNIEVKESGEIYVTFLHEGAGYKNILGYYSYPTDDPPGTIDELEKTVIFPNASAVRSGGGLIPGNSVELLGSFDAGTTIGFFLIANGWKNKITDGYYTQYTDINFNQSGRQQSLIFHERSCDAVVICFEDINVPNGDNDFNDAIFQIHAEPSTAINKEDYIQL